MIRSTMQEFQLTIPAIMRHGASVYGASECVTWTGALPAGLPTLRSRRTPGGWPGRWPGSG